MLKIEPRRRLRFPKLSFIPYVVAAFLLVGLLIVPEIIGQVLIIIYCLLTILLRYSITQTLVLATLLLVISPAFAWLTGNEQNGTVLSGYSFALLGLGLVQIILAYRNKELT